MSNRMTYFAALALTLAGTNAIAATIGNGKVEFQGTITAKPCYISSTSGDSATVNISMGSVSTADVKVSSISAPHFSGSSVGNATIKIQCSAETKVNMQFAAAPSELNPTNNVLRVNGGSTQAGHAQHVGIAVYPLGSTTAYNLSNGKLFTADQTVSAGSNIQLAFRAAYIKNSTTQDPTEGIANATLPFILTSD